MTLDELLLEPTTRQLLRAYCAQPKHGILLCGQTGVGLATIAHALATLVTEHATDILKITPDEKGTISIEQVRSLYISTRDKRTTRQVVVIDDIDAMSFDAQNAYLKLLEEPNDQTYFILTTHAIEALLPTIVSRIQLIDVRPVSDDASIHWLEQLHVVGETERQQMLFLAHGLPAELVRLSRNQEYFKRQADTVRAARSLLSAPLHDRLTLIASYTDRPSALRLVTILGALVEYMLVRTPQETKLIQTATVVEQTAKRLGANGHVRTQLMNLALQIT